MLRKSLLPVVAFGLIVASSPGARSDICFQYKTAAHLPSQKGRGFPHVIRAYH
jgi:hypothetical protein